MKNGLLLLILILIPASPLMAETSAIANSAIQSPEEILLMQAKRKQNPEEFNQNINERVKSLALMPKTIMDYLLGPGDSIELSVVGIPGLERREFILDGQGTISVPYVGQIELMGLKIREVESKVATLFAASLLENPQVSVAMKQYRSQYYYIIGSVRRPGKFPLSQSTDILDAITVAEGLTDRADTKIRIHRYLQRQMPEGSSVNANGAEKAVGTAEDGNSAKTIEISLTELLEGGPDINRIQLFSGDRVEVLERRERTVYILGDVTKPGPYALHGNESMTLAQAIGNAGGILRTASGKNALIIRQKTGEALPEQINVDAYKVLKGDVRDIVLLENDVVLVPGSTSRTLGRTVMNGLTGFLNTLILMAR
jgi:polysaccharide biosynthesis/export protein